MAIAKLISVRELWELREPGEPREREREREREVVAGWLAGWLAWLAGLKAIRTNRNPMFFIYSGLRLWLAGWLV